MREMKIRPLYDNVLVKRKDEEEMSAGGIVLPGSAKEKPNQGEVKAVGQGALLDSGEIRALTLKVGDTVVFGQYSGNAITVDGDELIIMRESEIYGVIED
jgi:chaperonin GroES